MKSFNAYSTSPLANEIWEKSIKRGIHTVTALARASGISYDRLNDCLHAPERFRLNDLYSLHRVLNLSPLALGEELKEGAKRA